MTCVSVIRGRVSMTCVSVAPPVWQYRNGGQAWPDALGASPSWRDLGRDTRQPCLHPATMFVGQAQAGSYPVAPPPTTHHPQHQSHMWGSRLVARRSHPSWDAIAWVQD